MSGPESRSPGDLNFHYDRAEREKSLSDAVRNRGRAGFLARNRHLVMILIDILVVTAVFIFLLPHIRGNIRELAGYRFELNATLFDGTILAAVKAENAGDALEEEVSLLFQVEPEGRELRLYAILNPAETNFFRGRIPWRIGDETLTVRIRIEGEELSLTTNLEPE